MIMCGSPHRLPGSAVYYPATIQHGNRANGIAPPGRRESRPRPSQAAPRRVSGTVWCNDLGYAYGGSQFVDSPGTGRYHSYLCDEVVAYVDAGYRTIPDAAHRAIMGKSSGGFGAMITPMLRPDVFGALATHAGDSLYEYAYIPEFPAAVRHLRKYDFNLDVGASAFRAALLDAGVAEDLIRFELFDATHSGIDYRYPLSLAWLCQRITDLPGSGAPGWSPRFRRCAMMPA
jgi:Putative esterase